MSDAIDWLRTNEGEESAACAAVAEFLEHEMKRRLHAAAIRRLARSRGLSVRDIRAMLRTGHKE